MTDFATLTPLCANVIAGTSSAGGVLRIVDEQGEIVTEIFAQRSRVDDRADHRFAFELPVGLRDGAARLLRLVNEDGHMLAQTRVQSNNAVGTIERVIGSIILGTVETDDEAAGELQLVALVGEEVVATAMVPGGRESSGRRPFALFVPMSVRANGERFVHVYVVGGKSALRGSPAVLDPVPRSPALFRQRGRPTTMAIKIAAPNLRVAHEWGDFHFATQLARALSRHGWVARVDCHEEWNRTGDDVVLVLRGRRRHIVDPAAINLLWQISHPDRAVAEEFADYEHIFVASDIYAKELERYTATPVSTLHQATDPAVFYPPSRKLPIGSSALFVGNSRREYRTLVKWCVESDIDCLVFGTHWKDIIPASYLRGEHISNDEVHRWYGSCGVLLNDHWETMRTAGFLSNRLFDGSAAGAFIISDEVNGLAAVFGDAIETAGSAEELKAKIRHYRQHPKAAAAKAQKARSIVLSNHTFEHRAQAIIDTVAAIRERPRRVRVSP